AQSLVPVAALPSDAVPGDHLFRHEYGQDDHVPQGAQATDHFLVGCLWRLLADPQLERGGSLLFPLLLCHLRDTDCGPAFLDWSPRRPWGTIHPREAATRPAYGHRE